MEIIFHMSMTVPDDVNLDDVIEEFITKNGVDISQVTVENIVE